MKLKIDVDDKQIRYALQVAEAFHKEFPDRVGVRNCAVYSVSLDYGTALWTLAVYRTKTGTIVVRKC